MKKIVEFFEGIPMTIVSGVFLLGSFILTRVGINTFIDLAWMSVIISGLPILCSAIRKLIYNKGISKISSALLISMAMVAAVIIGDLFAAGEVAFIMAIGEILEDMTTSRARKGLKNLIGLVPQKGRLINEGKETMIDADKICVGDVLKILPGEAIPVDGEIISGETSVDQSIMTGESLPVDKTVGDFVYCGTINRFGVIEIRASKVGEDSSLSALIRMVKEAEDKKAPMQRAADKWASLLVPVALVLAVAAYFVTKDITRAVTVLVVFCPCALVLATPTAIMAAIGQATKHGVVIKSGEALENMGKVDTVAFDKTGTLTHGKLTVSDIISYTDTISETELLSYAATAEISSEHPLGKAVVEFARKNKAEILEPEKFYMQSGKGVSAVAGKNKLVCGNEKFMAENNIRISEKAKNDLSKMRDLGKASIIIGLNGECIGVIALSDTLRQESYDVINKLENMGTSSVLLTGDNKKAAKYFADKAGINNIYAELLPEDKLETITNMQNENKTICMIGDGVNDAPALKSANVGVAMGIMGSDIAVEAADIALMTDDISKIPYIKRLSNETVKTIKISITLSLLINFAAILLSFFGLLNPTTGALVHNVGSCLVVLFAALLYDRKFE